MNTRKLPALAAATVFSMSALSCASVGAVATAEKGADKTVPHTTYHTQTVDNVEVFYRQAGAEDAPVLLLLHGFPSSSHQFRNLIPVLAENYRVIAPDFPGFGQTVAPPRGEYDYTFDNLATAIDGLTDALALEQYAMYVFDYGAPVGFRLATRNPEKVTAIITQNGNAYVDGVGSVFEPIQAYWQQGTQESRDALRPFLTEDTTRWQYTVGVPEDRLDRISPDAIAHDQSNLDRDAEIQLDLFRSYESNVMAYPEWQAYLRENQPPVLAIWGENDPFFVPAGAHAFKRDVPNAKVELLDAGHWPLETHLDEVSSSIKRFLKSLYGAR